MRGRCTAPCEAHGGIGVLKGARSSLPRGEAPGAKEERRRMNENGAGLLQERIRDLWENTDFTSTLFGSLTGYAVNAADFDGNVIAYNEGAHQVYRYAAEEVFGCYN